MIFLLLAVDYGSNQSISSRARPGVGPSRSPPEHEGDPAFAALSGEQSDARPKNRGLKPDNRALLKLNSDIKDFIFAFKVLNVFRYENVALRYRNAQKDFASKAFNKVSQLLYPADSRGW